jgi:hypothetical protein
MTDIIIMVRAALPFASSGALLMVLLQTWAKDQRAEALIE